MFAVHVCSYLLWGIPVQKVISDSFTEPKWSTHSVEGNTSSKAVKTLTSSWKLMVSVSTIINKIKQCLLLIGVHESFACLERSYPDKAGTKWVQFPVTVDLGSWVSYSLRVFASPGKSRRNGFNSQWLQNLLDVYPNMVEFPIHIGISCWININNTVFYF